ncbi:hypothetical protein GCM10010149_88580 [Nonomuraea roseoviolacea subsp. roseoviolacea]|uniref:hypothetical protein n=1 Tax=Nonomuraea roseoviolacea TaxID=103837 RepID=UPI0031DFF015
MNKPRAWAEIIEPLMEGDKHEILFHAELSPTQDIEHAISLEVAEELYLALGTQLKAVRALLKRQELITLERALERDDYHVNPRIVRCAADDCTERLMLPDTDTRHPWLVAQERGWKRLKKSSDLICPESALVYSKLVS